MNYKTGKYYTPYGDLGETTESLEQKITIDSNGFLDSYNDDPAIDYFNGRMMKLLYYQHGYLHRETGPSIIVDHMYVPKESFYLNGVNLSKEEYEIRMNRKTMLEEIL